MHVKLQILSRGLPAFVAALAIAGCSAALDTDKLQGGPEDDAGAYDASAMLEHLFKAPVRMALSAHGVFDFRWQNIPGRPNAFDLSFESDEVSLFQVFSRKGKPYARTGLKVVPLQQGASYALLWRATNTGLELSLKQGNQLITRTVLPLHGGTKSVRLVPAHFGRYRVVMTPRGTLGDKVIALR
jgi:hypothetical protein